MADDDTQNGSDAPVEGADGGGGGGGGADGGGGGAGNGEGGARTPARAPQPASQNEVLSLSQLIGGPIHALVDAEAHSAQATARFIRNVGFRPPAGGTFDELGDLQMARFTTKRPRESGGEETVDVQIPVLSMLPIPALQIRDAQLDYVVKVIQAEVIDPPPGAAAELIAARKEGISVDQPATMRATFANETSRSSRRSMDMLVKMRVRVEQADMPEGLARLLRLAAEEVSLVPRTDTETETDTSPSDDTEPAGG